YTKLATGTELKNSIPVKVAKNSKIKLLAGSTENYKKVEVVNIEVTVNFRDLALGEYFPDKKSYQFLETQSAKVTEFNKVAGDIAKVGDFVELLKEIDKD